MKHVTVDIRYKDRGVARQWARQMFGKSMGSDGTLKFHEMPWYSQPMKVGVRFYFKKPEHATMFALRWA